MQEQAKLLVTLHEIEGVGWKTLDKLVRAFSNLSEIFGVDVGELQQLGQLDSQLATRIKDKFTLNGVEACLARLKIAGVDFITFWDIQYPAELRRLAATAYSVLQGEY